MFAPRTLQQHSREQTPAQTRQTTQEPTHGLTPTEPVRGSVPFLQRYLGNSSLQSRITGEETPHESAVPSVVHDVVRSPGQPLDPTIRTDMESRFDADFSQVRVHTDTQAAESAQTVGALAYTTGSDITFGAGAYHPGTPQGRHRIAHELAHTLQQPRERGGQCPPQEISHPGDPAEREADLAATSVMAGRPIAALSRVSPKIQRQPLSQGPQKGQSEGIPPWKPTPRVVRDNGDDVVMVQGIEVARISPAGNGPLQRVGEAIGSWERLSPGTEYVRKGNSVSLRYIVSLHYQNNDIKSIPNQKGKATLEDILPSAEVHVRAGVKPLPPAAASTSALSNLTPHILDAAFSGGTALSTASRSPLIDPRMRQILQAKLGIEQPEVSMEEQLRQELEKWAGEGRPLTEPLLFQSLDPGEHATEFQKTFAGINVIGRPLPMPPLEQRISQVLKGQNVKVPIEIRAAELAKQTGMDQRAALAELRAQEEASRREQTAMVQQMHLDDLASQNEEDRHIPDPETLISQHNKWWELDKEGLARKLLRQAVQGNTEYVEKVFESLDWTDQDNVAVEFLKQANTPVLQKIRETEGGRRLILRVFNELSEGDKGADEEALGQWITELVMKKMTPEEFAEAKKRALIFPFKLPGFTVFDATNIRAEVKPSGKIHVKLSIRAHRMGRLPMEAFLGGLDLNEDDLVGIKDYEQARTYYVPALFLLQLANETDAATRQKMIETAGLAVSFGGGALATGGGRVVQGLAKGAQLGSRTGKVFQTLDTVATVADLSSSVIKEHQGYFIEQYGDAGRNIIEIIDKVSAASQIPGFARMATALPHLKTELRGAYDRWRTIRQMKKELSAADQAIEKQFESLVKQFESLPENALPDPSVKSGSKTAGEPRIHDVGPAPVPADAPPRISTPSAPTAPDFLEGPYIGPTAGFKGNVASRWNQLQSATKRALSRFTGGGEALVEGTFRQTYDLDVAKALAEDMIEKTPGREVGIWQNTTTGEVLVVQGSGNWAQGAVEDVPVLGGPWTFVEHYHPERNFAVPLPSVGDFEYLTHLAVTQHGGLNQRFSSQIRFRDPKTRAFHFTEYGYDPNLKPPFGPYFVKVETRGGVRMDLGFDAVAMWEDQLRNIVRKDPGFGTFGTGQPAPLAPVPGRSTRPAGNPAPRTPGAPPAQSNPPSAPAAATPTKPTVKPEKTTAAKGGHAPTLPVPEPPQLRQGPVPPARAAGQAATATRTPTAPPPQPRQPSAPPASAPFVKAPPQVAKPPQPAQLPSVTLGTQLSHGGDIGTLGSRGAPGTHGVFEANMPDGTPVAVKVYPDTPEFKNMFPLEMQAAEAVSKTSLGPRFYGEVQVGPGRRAFAMEHIKGDFPVANPSIGTATHVQEMEAKMAQGRISDTTLEDVRTFGEELLGTGYYYRGEVQGLIDTAGRYRPIDFQGVRKLSPNPVEQAEEIKAHWSNLQAEIDYLKRLRDELHKK